MLARKLRDLLWHAWLLLDYGFAGVMIRLFNKDGVRRRSLSIANASRIARRFLKAFHITLRVKASSTWRPCATKLPAGGQSQHLRGHPAAGGSGKPGLHHLRGDGEQLLGQLTRLGGCLYAPSGAKVFARGDKTFRRHSAPGFQGRALSEGTSTDGSTITNSAAPSSRWLWMPNARAACLSAIWSRTASLSEITTATASPGMVT